MSACFPNASLIWTTSRSYGHKRNLPNFQSEYEHSEQARAPHTNGPRDVPRCGALSLSSKDAALQGGMIMLLMPLFAAALDVRRRYFIVAPRPFPAAQLVVHCR